MNNRLYIFDTTLRDGEQVPGCQLNTVEKIQVARQLEKLGVDKITAAKDACRSEHVISPESFAAIKKFFNDNSFTK